MYATRSNENPPLFKIKQHLFKNSFLPFGMEHSRPDCGLLFYAAFKSNALKFTRQMSSKRYVQLPPSWSVELVSRFHGNLSYLIKHEIKALFSRYNCGFDIDTSFRFLLHISLHISKLTEASS